MYAEELITLIRQRTAYRGASTNDSAAWRSAVNMCCEVIDELMSHEPKVTVEQPTSYVTGTTPETPIKKFGKKKEE